MADILCNVAVPTQEFLKAMSSPVAWRFCERKNGVLYALYNHIEISPVDGGGVRTTFHFDDLSVASIFTPHVKLDSQMRIRGFEGRVKLEVS